MKKLIAALLICIFSLNQIVLADSNTLRPLSSSITSLFKSQIIIDDSRFPSPFEDAAVNMKLSTILLHWVNKLGFAPESLVLDFPKQKPLELLEQGIKDLDDGDVSSPEARNIAKRILSVEIYKRLLDVHCEIGVIPIVSSNLNGLRYSPVVGWASSYLWSHFEEFPSFVRTNRYRYRYVDGKLEEVAGMPGEKREEVNMFVVTTGNSTLGIGNVGEASVPVMFGKTELLRAFGGKSVKAEICYVDVQQAWQKHDHDAVIETVISACKALREKNPNAAIMLEDIAAPGCFEIQRMLNEEEGIFTIHDDQWGTAIVFILAVIIALNIAKKEPKKCKVVICGAGAAGVAVAKLLNTMGIGEIIAFDSKGPIHEGRDYLPPAKMELAKMNVNGFAGTMKEALEGADGFIGLSEPNLFFGQEIELLQEMANNAFVFAGANPDPEFDLEAIAKYREEGGPLENIAFFGGGGFGKPGATLNNSSAFPGLYKALTDAIAEGKFLAKGKIDLAELALACAKALVPLLTKEDLARGSVVPRTFTNDGYNFKLTQAVATAAWQVFTGESPEAARERYKNLPDELRKEQQDTIDKLEGLPPDLKMFMQGLIELIGVTNDAMKEMRKKVSIDPDVPQTPSPAPNPAPRGPIPAEYLHLIGQAA